MEGMHELFHGLHGNQLRRRRNPLKQPASDRAQRRDAPLDRLSKDLHSMLHGTHDSPASLEPEKQEGVLGRLSAGMHGMLHGLTRSLPTGGRSLSERFGLRTAAHSTSPKLQWRTACDGLSPDRPQHS